MCYFTAAFIEYPRPVSISVSLKAVVRQSGVPSLLNVQGVPELPEHTFFSEHCCCAATIKTAVVELLRDIP